MVACAASPRRQHLRVPAAGVSQAVGLHVWRQVPAGLEVVQGRFHGQFFSGDCYVVLHGVDRGGVIDGVVHALPLPFKPPVALKTSCLLIFSKI